MNDSTGGQTNTDRSEVTELVQQIADLKSAQAGSDRQVTTLKQAIEEKDNRLAELEAQLKETADVLKTARSASEALGAEKEDLLTRLSEMESLSGQLEAKDRELGKMRLVMGRSKDNPGLLVLASNDALPTFDGDEESYNERLDSIVEGLGLNATQATAPDADVGRPPSSPPQNSQTKEEVWREYNEAAESGDVAKADDLRRQYYSMT